MSGSSLSGGAYPKLPLWQNSEAAPDHSATLWSLLSLALDPWLPGSALDVSLLPGLSHSYTAAPNWMCEQLRKHSGIPGGRARGPNDEGGLIRLLLLLFHHLPPIWPGDQEDTSSCGEAEWRGAAPPMEILEKNWGRATTQTARWEYQLVDAGQ